MRRPITDLGEDLVTALAGRDLIVFDGECVLCSGFFHVILRYDAQQRFAFALAQSDLGQGCYQALGLPLEDFQTNLVIQDGWIYTDLDAFAAAMSGLGWPWKALAACAWLPRFIKLPLYRTIAKNRYKLFGRYQNCMMPDQHVQSRFLKGGWV